MQEHELKQALSLREAAVYAGIQRSSLYRAIAGELPGAPRLPSLKVAGRRLVLKDDLATWLSAQRQ